MSITIEIGCRKCKESLWIGQDRYVYLDEEQTMEDLSNFVGIHRDHEVVLNAGDGMYCEEFCTYTDYRDNRRKPKDWTDELLESIQKEQETKKAKKKAPKWKRKK